MGKAPIELSNLPDDEHFELADELGSSFPPGELGLSAEVRAALDHRLDRLDRDGLVGVDWEDVRAEMIAGQP